MTARARGGRLPPASIVAATLVFSAVLAAAAVVIGWPIYADASYPVAVGVSWATSAVLAVAAARRRAPWWQLVAAGAVEYVVLGIPLAMPWAIAEPSRLGEALRSLVAGPVIAWKDLLTLDVPVGSYHTVLIPALLVSIASTLATVRLGLHPRRSSTAIAALAAWAPLCFSLSFGSRAVSEPIRIAQIAFIAPAQVAVALGALIATVLWIGFATSRWRRLTLVAVRRAPLRRAAARSALGVGIVVAALVAAIAVTPAAAGLDRGVLRQGVDPELVVASQVSPLADYRAWFGDDRYDEELFRVEGDAGDIDRIRIATLDEYTGGEFRVSHETRFTRIPTPRSGDADAAPARLDVTIGAYTGAWVPTAGALRGAPEFHGDRASSLVDGFYYAEESGAGLDAAPTGEADPGTGEGVGLVSGDSYTIEAAPSGHAPLAEQQPVAAGGTLDEDEYPNLLQWIDLQAQPATAAGLEELAKRLLDRGYLTHSLEEGEGAGAGNSGEVQRWIEALQERSAYTFQAAYAGHSRKRIEALFGDLVAQQLGTGDEASSGSSASLVGAAGDDEQFATAIALIARELGFDSRVVVGAKLRAGGDARIPACENGTCRGSNLVAWVEVRGGGQGDWSTIDATPQFTMPMSPVLDPESVPENRTKVLPDRLDPVPAPLPDPIDADAEGEDDAGTGPFERALEIALIWLLKWWRRRSRFLAPSTELSIVGGWEEYVDAAVDRGREGPATETRVELARGYATPHGVRVAEETDRAVFSSDSVTERESEEFWRIVRDELANFDRGSSLWRRFRASISMRSFARHLPERRRGPDTRGAQGGAAEEPRSR